MIQRIVFINIIRMLQRKVFINKIRMLQRKVFIYKFRMLQLKVFVNKIRMLQRKRRNTIGRRSTRVRMTCLAFPLWLERHSSSLLSFVSFSYQFSSVICLFVQCIKVKSGPGSSVAIATELRAGRSGIESRWGWDFPSVQTSPGVHPASCKMGTGSFPGVKCGQDVLLITHPLLVPRSWKSRAIPLPTLWDTPSL